MDMACPYSASFWHYTDFDNFCKGFCLEIFKFLIHIRKDLVFFMFPHPLSPILSPGPRIGPLFHFYNESPTGILPSFEKKNRHPLRPPISLDARVSKKVFPMEKKPAAGTPAVTNRNIYNRKGKHTSSPSGTLTIIFKII